MSTKVKINYRTLAEYLHGKHGVERLLQDEADRVLAAAKSRAPVFTGAYRDGLRIETVQHPSRMVKRVTSDQDYALLVEARDGTLARSLDAAKGS